MTEPIITCNKTDATSGLAEAKKTELTKITGTLTSPIQLRGENTKEPYYYSFLRCQGQSIDLPVIFKLENSDHQLIILKKGTELELTGNYSNSTKNIRKSFTAHSYQLGNEKKIRKKKECFGCGDTFTYYQKEDYDYCRNCAINGNRYIPGRFTKNNCPECGDGSGIIKFPQQAPRDCKTCHLAKVAVIEQAKSQLPELEKKLEQIRQVRQQLTSHD